MGNQCEGFSSTTVNKQPRHSEQNKDFPNHRTTFPQRQTKDTPTTREGENTKIKCD